MNSLGRKVLVASLSVLLLLAGCFSLVAREVALWDLETSYVMRDYRRAVLEGVYRESMTHGMAEMTSLLLTGSQRYRDGATHALDRAAEAANQLREIFDKGPAHPGDRIHIEYLDRQARLLATTRAAYDQLIATLSEVGTVDAAGMLNRIHEQEVEADTLWIEIVRHHRVELEENEAALRSHSQRAGALVLVSLAAVVVWVSLLVYYVRRRIVGPLINLAQLTKQVAAGDLSPRATVTHRDEIGQLQRSFNQMVEEVTVQRDELASMVDHLSLSRDAAESANRAKSDFLANVSHEIRTPMNGVIVTLDLIHETAPNAEQRDLVNVARSSARSLLRMLNDLLDLSRIEAGKVVLDEVGFDPRQLVTQMVDMHGKRAVAGGLKMQCDIADDVPQRVSGDPMRLGQILLNLLDNAIKFTERGGIEVSVAVEPPPAHPAADADADQVWLRFCVKDSGIGIAPEAAERIFQPFQQAGGMAPRGEGGIGLGLGIARQLTHMMGGELSFESEPGRGTCFRFNVCLRPGREADTEAPTPAVNRKLPTCRKVLLAEDNHSTRLVMGRMLERRGLRVTAVENGREALAHATDEAFDLILMDCQMPEMDGFEAARRIRQLGGDIAKTPIVALTAYGLIGLKERFAEAGFDDLVAKPYTVEDIEEALYRWLVLTPRPPAAPGEAGEADQPPG
ncbi:ATP-binding protein [Ideonella sp. A 288]|uniref:ATP-binding protein n=1 Tax=Ideonella sp. A 288 TaxID=1962181 RepID=UPI000B4B4A6D|nr:ATP-binding protein [Ideonella sp. A 288]